MSEIDAIKQDLAELKTEVKDSLSGMRSDIKELAAALRDLIRLDGDLGRVADMANRIGKQVDDLFQLLRSEVAALDLRLRTVETSQAGNSKSVGLFDSLVRHGLLVVVSGGIGAALAKALG